MFWYCWRYTAFVLHALVFLTYAIDRIRSEIHYFNKRSVFIKNEGLETANSDVYFATPFSWKFYTTWAHAMLMVTFGLITISDIMTAVRTKFQFGLKNYEQNIFQKTHDILLTSMVFPQTFVVSLAYWSMYIITRGKVFQNVSNPSALTSTSNHLAHTFPPLIVICEMMLVYHYKLSFVKGLLVSGIPGVAYIVFVSLYGHATGVWPYAPLRGKWIFKILLSITAGLVSLLLFAFGFLLHKIAWSQDRKELFFTGKITAKIGDGARLVQDSQVDTHTMSKNPKKYSQQWYLRKVENT